MAKILAICQSGGEFLHNPDGTLKYSGGEAHALHIPRHMLLEDLISEIRSMFHYEDSNAFTIKYFLPHNRSTLITVSSDKDLQRMVDFHSSSDSTDLFILNADVPDNRSTSVVSDTEETTLDVYEPEKRRRVCNTEWDRLITGVGQTFDGAKSLRDALHRYAIANSFAYRFIKNDGQRLTAECSAEGCPWRIHASKNAGGELVVRKLNDVHTCGREACNRLATQRWVASVIKERLRDAPDYKPKDIASDLQREYGLNLNYTQAWRGKFFAKQELHNSHEEACNQLPWFCERIVETNPGSVATLETSDDSKVRLFVAFHASLVGFEQGCRPLLFLDAIHVKANKHWRVLVASAVDGENCIYPVAISVVADQTRENWHWFLMQLKSALSMSDEITFISNRRNGLEEEVTNVFEDCYHGYCVNSLIEEFKSQLNDSWTQELKATMFDYFKQAIYACKVDEFNECIESIKVESKELAEWVLATGPELWSNAFFKGLRHGYYTSNASETFNTWVLSRYEPAVVQMVDMIRCRMMEMIYTRRESSNTWSETLTPSMNEKLQEEIGKAGSVEVVCSTGSVFQARDESINVVNIETRECTCRRWQVFGLPCMHALAVLERTDRCVYDYCSRYFTTDCYRLIYSSSIMPIPDVGRPLCIAPVNSMESCSRRVRRQVGRPKERPADPRITVKRVVRCGRCKGYGHNKATCKEPF